MSANRGDERKLAFFLPNLQLGGVERVTLYLAEGFSGIGRNVELVLSNATGDYLSSVPRHIAIKDLQAPRVLLCFTRLRQYLARERPAVLLTAQDYATPLALIANRLVRHRAKTVVILHGMISRETKNSKNLRGKATPWLLKCCLRWADEIIAVSQGTARDVAKTVGFPVEKIQVVYNPVILPDFSARCQEKINHPWFTPGSPPVIIAAGRLERVKSYHTLIRAFARVRSRIDARLLILGEGEERAHLAQLAEELQVRADVSLPGFVKNPLPYLSQARVFVLSSRYESLPTVVIEALAAGTPVIATDCPGGIREILPDGKNWGCLIPMDDIEAMSQTLFQVLTITPPCVSATAWQPYLLDTVIAQYAKLLFQPSSDWVES
jgi:glycosyltransferase involved in cell wall biosynthesis